MPSRSSSRIFHLKLPGSSANLGAGFDAVGLAISLYLEVSASLSKTWVVEGGVVEGEDLIAMTYREVLAHQGLAAPPLRLDIHNEVPIGMGCGSSAAALLAGVYLADFFGDMRWTRQQILDEACRREGHPDNVAACFCGGMTISTVTRTVGVEPEPTVVTATCGEDLRWPMLLALPRGGLPTKAARSLLPESYSRADAVANLQSTAMLVAAFSMNRPELLRVGMRDRFHQPYRMEACPLLGRLLPLAERPDVMGVALSGAGPSVLLILDPSASVAAVREAVEAAGGPDLAEIRQVGIGRAAVTSVTN